MSDPRGQAADDERLRTLFDELVELPAETRLPRIDALTLPDPLRRELLALLTADASRAALLEMPVTTAIDRLRDHHDYIQGLIGNRLGPFRVLELIGEGGSSLVLRAEREAGDGVQQVALKLMRTGLYSAEGQRRFRREQAILAQLNHPNIARLVEAGISEAGVPYIAMELVQGEPITAYAAQRALDLRRRLALFVSLCRAVETAHAALIVHRDLKPGNVLVDAQGEVKILDFGIAKLLDDEGDAGNTRTQTISLTPEYAAPEQYLSGPATTATDVFALGVLLGELLTGARPVAGGAGVSSLVAGLPNALPPAGLGDAATLTRQLRGDLDAIVATAVAEEPGQRYRAAGALADDVERFLANQPVVAHPPTRLYRARKFVQRHRGGVVLASLLGIGILISLVVAVLQAHRAEQQAALAAATRDFLVDVFREAEPAGPRAAPPTVVDVTTAALARVDREESSPRVRLDLKTQLGAVLRRQSQLPQAIAVLKQAGDDGAAAFGEDDPLVFDARVELGEASIAAGDYEEADALVLALRDLAPRQDAQRRIDYALFALNIATKRGLVDEALVHAEQADATCRADCDVRTRLAILTAKGVVLTDLGRHADAASTFAESVALARRTHGEAHVEVATALNSLSGAYRRLGRLEDARRLSLEAIAIDDRVLPALHWRRSIHWNYLGNVYMGLDDERAALDAFRRAAEQSIATTDGDDPSLSLDLSSIAVLQSRLGQTDAAWATFADSIARAARGYGPEHRVTARIRANHAFHLAAHGRVTEALPLVRDALADLVAEDAATQTSRFDALRQHAKIAWLAGEFDTSLAALDEADAIAARTGTAIREAGRMTARVTRGQALVALQRPAEAQPVLAEALHRLDALAVENMSRAEAHLALADVARSAANCTEASAHVQRARAILDARPFVLPYLRDALMRGLRAPCPG